MKFFPKEKNITRSLHLPRWRNGRGVVIFLDSRFFYKCHGAIGHSLDNFIGPKITEMSRLHEVDDINDIEWDPSLHFLHPRSTHEW
jgi:hypothetical protein